MLISNMWYVATLFMLLATVRAFPIENDQGGSDESMLNAGFFGGDMAGFDPDGRNAIWDRNLLWPSGRVPYVIDNSLSHVSNLIRQSMEQIHQTSCLRFYPRTNERDYILIKYETGCWSFVGKQGGMQVLSLGQGCHYKGIIMHELLHVVGFWHEQNRPDRDNWLTIYWNNIMNGQEHNFNKFNAGGMNLLNEQYDYSSIMQYGEYSFSKDGSSATIWPKVQGVRIGDVWEKFVLSQSDLRSIKKLYNC